MTQILAIEDTRSRDDEGHIIPDSGDNSPCDRCGRPHTVQYVLSDGRRMGATCAKRLGITEMGKRYEIRTSDTLIDNARTTQEHCDIDARWVRSLERFAANHPTGVIEVVDRVNQMRRVVVSGGMVNVDAGWEYTQ